MAAEHGRALIASEKHALCSVSGGAAEQCIYRIGLFRCSALEAANSNRLVLLCNLSLSLAFSLSFFLALFLSLLPLKPLWVWF